MRKSPIRDKLTDSIRRELMASEQPAGTQLPSERDYAARYGVSHLTVRSALDILEREKLIERRPSSGTFLKKPPSTSDSWLVAVVMRNEGHFFADMHFALSTAFQRFGLVPLSIPFLYGHTDWTSFDSQLQAARHRGCRRLLIQKSLDFLVPPLSEKLSIGEKALGQWDRVVWFGAWEYLPAKHQGVLVCNDYENILRQAVRLLKADGRKRISFLTRPPLPECAFPDEEWLPVNTFCRVMTEEGLGTGIMVTTQKFDYDINLAELVELFKTSSRPDAIIASLDYRAATAFEAAKRVGLDVPGDIAIIGDYDTPWSHSNNLATFSRNQDVVATHAAKLLSVSEKDYHDSPRIVKVKATMIHRASCPALETTAFPT